MSDYRATPEQWDALEQCTHAWPGAWGPCILELRARVEALEANSSARLTGSNYPEKPDSSLVEWRDRAADREAAFEASAKSTPKDRQIRSSLVERVHSCIVGEPECGHMQARAVIREVAAWMREQQDGDLIAATMLEREAER